MNIQELTPDPVSLAERVKMTKKLKNKKSSGYDQVFSYMITLFPPAYVECLEKCFNIWLQECRYPLFLENREVGYFK